MNTGGMVLAVVAALLIGTTVVSLTVELVSAWLKRDFARRFGVDPDDYL